jgi:phage portal protein BeeE
MGTEFDTANLLRMDTVTQITAIRDAVGAGVMAPDEGRALLDLGKVPGGKSPYLQQQNYSLEALAKRDAQADPFAPNTPPPQQQLAAADTAPQADQAPPPAAKDFDMAALFAKELQDAHYATR